MTLKSVCALPPIVVRTFAHLPTMAGIDQTPAWAKGEGPPPPKPLEEEQIKSLINKLLFLPQVHSIATAWHAITHNAPLTPPPAIRLVHYAVQA